MTQDAAVRIVVGSGIAERLPQVAEAVGQMMPIMEGHIIKGAGHLVQVGPDLMQLSGNQLVRITSAFTRGSQEVYRVYPIAESTAWERFKNEVDFEREMQILKELGLAYGSASAGDLQGAFEHGVQAGAGCVEMFMDRFGAIGSWNGGVDR